MSLWGIAAFFNPFGSSKRMANLWRFARSVRAQGLKLCIVSQSDGRLPDCDMLIQLSGGAVLWQKERLLNLGLDNLPADCDKVAWLDTDLLFENDGWVREAAQALEKSPVVQLFDTYAVGEFGEFNTGIAAYQHKHGDHGDPAIRLGHSGYAWAGRRELLAKHGFYDRCIIGGGDVVMAWACYGLLWPGHGRAANYFSPAHLKDIAEWSCAWHADVRGQVGYVPGIVGHLDHGPRESRKYEERLLILQNQDYDPDQDIINGDGVWHWSSNKPALHAAVASYLESRESPRSAASSPLGTTGCRALGQRRDGDAWTEGNAVQALAAVERSEERQQQNETVKL